MKKYEDKNLYNISTDEIPLTKDERFPDHMALGQVAGSRLVQVEKRCNHYRSELVKWELRTPSVRSVLDRYLYIIIMHFKTNILNSDSNVVLVKETDSLSYEKSLESNVRRLERESLDREDRLYESTRHQALMQKELWATRERLSFVEMEESQTSRALHWQKEAMEQYTNDLKSSVKKRFG